MLAISDEFRPKDARKLTLKLQKAPMVQGRVLDAKGNPVAGMEVSARMLTMDDIPRAYADFAVWANTTKSDANGAFSVPLVAKDLNHFIGINPLQKLASPPVVVTGAETDIELVLK